ncbi:MAG: response regulator transcription factor [Dissulfuribacterales bacterium]
MSEAANILIIEDDKDIRRILKDQLELDGFSVTEAASGTEGMYLFKKRAPALILLDLNLPDLDGIKICQMIRNTSDVPIVMLTARDALSDKVRGFECGADDYIVKPFEYLELKARILANLRRRAAAQKDELIFEPLRISLKTRDVFLNGRAVPLTRKEYDLLELFVTQPNRVLEREYIVRQLWPNGEIYAWSRALDVHIRRLRQKIEADSERPRFIITHPGVGYRFQTSKD